MKKLVKSSVRLVIPVGRPTEIREILLKSGRGQAVNSYSVRLESGKKQKLERLAAKAGIMAPELIRLLLEAAISIDLVELTRFIKAGLAARKVKIEKPELEDGDDNEKLHFKIDRKSGPETDDDSGEEESAFQIPKTGTPTLERKRQGKRQRTGTPRPNEERKL